MLLALMNVIPRVAKSTIGAIRNAILETKVKSLRVFNTSKEEVKHWIANQPNFAKNKASC